MYIVCMNKFLLKLLLIFCLNLIFVFPLKIEAQSLYLLSEVEQHQIPQDCWVAIEGRVYDLSEYLPEHDRWLDIRDWCGQDATQDYNNKAGLNKAHSLRADEMLAEKVILMSLQTRIDTIFIYLFS
jgi:predicted heme/steroid binding protein